MGEVYRARDTKLTITTNGPIENAQVGVPDLKTGRRKILSRGGSDAEYVDSGHLVYASAGALRVVRFDLNRHSFRAARVGSLASLCVFTQRAYARRTYARRSAGSV